MVDILFASLFDALRIQQDLRTGNADLQEANDSSARFVKALNTLIDQRINLNIEDRKKFRNKEKDNIKYIIALNSAPSPLDEVDLEDADFVREWFKQYKHWYETKRKAG